MTVDDMREKRFDASQLRASLEIDKIARSIAEALWTIAIELRTANTGNGAIDADE